MKAGVQINPDFCFKERWHPVFSTGGVPAGWVGMGHFLGFPDDLELQVSATPFQLFSLEAPSRASPGLSEQLGLISLLFITQSMLRSGPSISMASP